MDGEKNMPEYKKDISLEMKFSKTIKGILGNYFFIKDDIHDHQNGTDFCIFMLFPKRIRVATRLRRFKHFKNYGDQFTIRWSRPSGEPTEIDKINWGLVDYFLYGFVDQKEEKIIKYFLGDLAVFRNEKPNPFEIRNNFPFDSQLGCFKISQLSKKFILHSYSLEANNVRLD